MLIFIYYATKAAQQNTRIQNILKKSYTIKTTK